MRTSGESVGVGMEGRCEAHLEGRRNQRAGGD